MSDPIREALAEVEADGEHVEAADPGAGQPEHGEEPEAMPEGPAPELPEEGGESENPVLSWAKSVPDGSHTDFDATDWWDPENGGKNRLAFHLSQAADVGAGYPNALGVLVALAELYWTELRNESSTSDEQEENAPDAETVPAETAEALT